MLQIRSKNKFFKNYVSNEYMSCGSVLTPNFWEKTSGKNVRRIRRGSIGVAGTDPTYTITQVVLTLWLHNTHTCLEECMRDLVTTGRVRFIAFGEEVCPSSKALHCQAYSVGYDKIRNKQLMKWFGEEHFFETHVWQSETELSVLQQGTHICQAWRRAQAR